MSGDAYKRIYHEGRGNQTSDDATLFEQSNAEDNLYPRICTHMHTHAYQLCADAPCAQHPNAETTKNRCVTRSRSCRLWASRCRSSRSSGCLVQTPRSASKCRPLARCVWCRACVYSQITLFVICMYVCLYGTCVNTHTNACMHTYIHT